MSSVSVKNFIEEKVKNSSDQLENQVHITFETLKNDVPVLDTITLTGNGCVKVLVPA